MTYFFRAAYSAFKAFILSVCKLLELDLGLFSVIELRALVQVFLNTPDEQVSCTDTKHRTHQYITVYKIKYTRMTSDCRLFLA